MRIISGSLSGACWRLLTQNNQFSYQKWRPGTSLDPAGASWLRMNDFPTRRPAEGSLAPGGCQRHRKTWKMQTLSVSQLVVRTIYVVCLSVMDPRASLEHPGTSWLRMTHFPLKNTLLELLWSQRRRRPPDGQKAANGPFSFQKFPESRRRPQERRRRPPEAQESRRRPQERRRRAARSPESRRWPQTAARKPAPDARRMHTFQMWGKVLWTCMHAYLHTCLDA